MYGSAVTIAAILGSCHDRPRSHERALNIICISLKFLHMSTWNPPIYITVGFFLVFYCGPDIIKAKHDLISNTGSSLFLSLSRSIYCSYVSLTFYCFLTTVVTLRHLIDNYYNRVYHAMPTLYEAHASVNWRGDGESYNNIICSYT